LKSISVAKYIVDFFNKRGVNRYFGHPGGMITFLTDEINLNPKTKDFIFHHEQAASFAACGLAQATNKPAIVYSTSGPGFTNLITGIANAYYDSIPVIFITGNVSIRDSSINYRFNGNQPRQHGFQETDVISIVKSITKYAVYVDNAYDLPRILNLAYEYATSNRKGPVLIDIPINILKEEIDNKEISQIYDHGKDDITYQEDLDLINSQIDDLLINLKKSRKPILILGNGCNYIERKDKLGKLISKFNAPYCTSMISTSLMTLVPDLYIGFVGVYGHRNVNFTVEEADLIIAIGSRLDLRQVGLNNTNLLKHNKLYRVEIDQAELNIDKSLTEIKIKIDIAKFIDIFSSKLDTFICDYSDWKQAISKVDSILKSEEPIDKVFDFINKVSSNMEHIYVDVGQNQVWTSQKMKLKGNQKLFHSGGHGAMGYSFPSAIGCAINFMKPVLSISGDGGFQMNLQELETVRRNNLPVKMLILNNSSLGMISEFQGQYLKSRYSGTKTGSGYSSPCFADIAKAYNINSILIKYEDLNQSDQVYDKLMKQIVSNDPLLIEIIIPDNLNIAPRTIFGKGLNDRYPYLDPDLVQSVLEVLRNV
jgi:acetolactate synthase I/II/III large subunit